MVRVRGLLCSPAVPSAVDTLRAGARWFPRGGQRVGLCWGRGGSVGGREGRRALAIRWASDPSVSVPQTCRGVVGSRGRSPGSACPASGPRRAEAGPPSSCLVGLQDPHAGGVGTWVVGPAPPSLWGQSSLNKETDRVAWVPSPMWSRAPGQPRGLGHIPFLHQRGCGHGLEKTLTLWAWLGPSDTGILAVPDLAAWTGWT